jgi:hypothetical protein
MYPLPHNEIQELLGAFALDAVDADEAEAIEAHLVTCPRCSAEVREHREVASLLAYSGSSAPAGMWERLAPMLDEAPPASAAPVLGLGNRVAAREAGRRPRRRVGLVSAVAAAALFAGVGTMGGVQLQSALNSPPSAEPSDPDLRRAAEAALADGARIAHLETPDKVLLADAVVSEDGTGYLLNKSAKPLPSTQTYQLWAVAGGQKLSVGVLGNQVDVVTFRAPKATDALALTVEQAPGVVASQNQAVGYGLVKQ